MTLALARQGEAPFDLKSAWDYVGGLSDTTKMPWVSYSTPASACVTGAALAAAGKHTVCGNCYALKGRYSFPSVQQALERRLDAMTNKPRFVEAFVFLLRAKARRTTKPKLFRWFDSGDVPSVAALERIIEIAVALPEIRFWLPTREFGIVKRFLDGGGVFPANLTVRMSTALIGAKPSHQPFGLPFATVGRDDDAEIFQCGAFARGGVCGDCDACWTDRNVNYERH